MLNNCLLRRNFFSHIHIILSATCTIFFLLCDALKVLHCHVHLLFMQKLTYYAWSIMWVFICSSYWCGRDDIVIKCEQTTVEVLMIGEVGHPQRGFGIVAVKYSSWPISALLKGRHFQLTSPVHLSRPLFMVCFLLPATHTQTRTCEMCIHL